MTVHRLIAEPLLEHKLVSGKQECRERVKEILQNGRPGRAGYGKISA